MNFYWAKDTTYLDTRLDADQLDRAKYAEFLTNYLESFSGSSQVFNLNAEWGAGKTYFLKRWCQSISDEHPATYIDAWRNDFSDDPLLTVVGEILKTLEKYPNTEVKKNRAAALRTTGRFLKQATPALIKGVVRTYSGFDTDRFELEDFDDFSEKLMSAALSDHSKKSKDLEDFKKVIKAWLKEATASGRSQLPMFIFIDELDRCRPTYAIELLEMVKHLFDIPGLVFVIATNTEQLQHSIKAVYGQDFDANRYLKRFFNRGFTLKKPRLSDYLRSRRSFYAVASGFHTALMRTGDGAICMQTEDDISDSLGSIAEFFQFDLRTTEQWLTQLYASFLEEKNKNKYFWLCLAVMSAIKLHDENSYQQLFHKSYQHKWNDKPGLEVVRSTYSDLQVAAGDSLKKIEFSVTPKHLGSQEFDNGTEFDGTLEYKCEVSVLAFIIQLVSFFDERQSFNKHSSIAEQAADVYRRNEVDTWARKSFCVNLAMDYFESQIGTKKINYCSLVELASDLE